MCWHDLLPAAAREFRSSGGIKWCGKNGVYNRAGGDGGGCDTLWLYGYQSEIWVILHVEH